MIITGLIVILLMVLALPFLVKKIEENLEPFLFVMGVAAVLLTGKMNAHLVLEALEEPVMIALAVLIAGALFYVLKERFEIFMAWLLERVPVAVVVGAAVLVLGLLSSVITAIIASIILVEVIAVLPIKRTNKITICVLACFSIGLGASLTPIGEPLATIAISKLDKDFFYLIDLLGRYIMPAVLAFSVLAGLYTWKIIKNYTIETEVAMTSENAAEKAVSPVVEEDMDIVIEADTWKGIIIRALKVYIFVMALVFLGQGFEPLIEAYILNLSPKILYWVNMVSAVLDNATLCAAEISPSMGSTTVEAILMGLLISGGMLIPGNIPNIISASKLRITSKEWAKIGVPIGLVVMIGFFLLLPI